MVFAVCSIERRASLRVQASAIVVCVTANGHRIKIPPKVINFNQYGIALLCKQHLNCSHSFRISLKFKSIAIGPVEAALHNCRKLKNGEFRCGIQFRPDSPFQLDTHRIKAELHALEQLMLEAATME